MCELHAENCFYIQISIELKVKCARFVLNGFTWFAIQQRELRTNYRTRLIVWNHYFDLYSSHSTNTLSLLYRDSWV